MHSETWAAGREDRSLNHDGEGRRADGYRDLQELSRLGRIGPDVIRALFVLAFNHDVLSREPHATCVQNSLNF
jgi:hypothetical protein